MIISRTRSLSASTATNIATWPKNVEIRRKRKKLESVFKCNKEEHIVRDCKEKQSMKKQKI